MYVYHNSMIKWDLMGALNWALTMPNTVRAPWTAEVCFLSNGIFYHAVF